MNLKQFSALKIYLRFKNLELGFLKKILNSNSKIKNNIEPGWTIARFI
jgi:hypothetical protein